ncbi:MAG TPA: glycoside hydrolase family 127 protein [Candidatus Merdenecus merdavium]|nr:glycoside hydrolase family 127 protein [Candidatus Merdenecus merdavium]
MANSSIPLNHIKIDDIFWNKYIKHVKEVIIPYQWEALNDRLEGVEPSHCIENFRIAAGESKGEFAGAVFQDTDVAKWLEAVAFVLSHERDEELEKIADETIELIGRAQQADGYLNTYYTIKAPSLRFSNLTEGHELYTAGHMIEAAVAYYEATGKDKFLQIVSKFADLICENFGNKENQIHGYPGHQEIELALVKLYRITGEKRYLDTAKYFIDARGVGENYFLKEEKSEKFKRIFPEFERYDPKYSQSHAPVREQKTAEGHAVRATYMYSAMADLADEYGDQELLKACDTIWDDMVNRRMYITGSIGSSGILERFTTDYDLPNDVNYSETCASIGLALFGKRMAQIKKDATYIDVVERALYNTVLAGIALDGQSFFYVNPLEMWPDSCIDRTSKEHVKTVRQTWFGVACCPPNIARTLASLGQYIYFQEEDTIYVNMYIGNVCETSMNQVPIRLTLTGEFPWKSSMTIQVEAEREVSGCLAFRIPDYAQEFQILKNGKKVEKVKVSKGYAYLEGVFYHDTISIEFQMESVFVHAHPAVRENVGKVAVVKGPLVYCLEETDNFLNLASIFVNTEQPLEEEFEEELLDGTIVIKFKGKKVREDEWDAHTLYKIKGVEFQDVPLKAIPYCYWNNRKSGEMMVWIKELYQEEMR